MADFLKYLNDADQRALVEKSERARFDEDEVIIREGEEKNALFLIRKGGVRVEREHDDFRYEISRLGPGELFGEMGFVEGFVASANVVANETVEVDIIAAVHVHALSEGDPGFSGRFYKSLAEILSQRLRETTVRNVADFSWGGSGRSERGRDRFVPPDDDAWGGPQWDLDDEIDDDDPLDDDL